MGRKKLVIKPIENKNNRHVTFSKRRTGLLKKAEQLSVLCDVQIAGIIFSERNKLYQFSHGNSLDAILQRYQEVSQGYEGEATGVRESKISESARIQEDGSLLQRVQRYLDELILDPFTVDKISQVERELKSTLLKVRAIQDSINALHMMEPIQILEEKEKVLREENELLKRQIAAMAQENLAAKQMDDNPEVDAEENNEAQQQQTLCLFF